MIKSKHKIKTVKFKENKKNKKHKSIDNKIKHKTINTNSHSHIRFSNSSENLNLRLKRPITVINSEPAKEILNTTKLDDNNVDTKEFNIIPYQQAIRIDDRNYFQIFLSVIFNEIKIIRIFYYKNPYEHLSIILSLYLFELCLDLTFNCLLYTEDVISEKYNNDGSIKFFTSLSLSFVSNIIASFISFILSKLTNYAEYFESILKDIVDINKYYLVFGRFKKFIFFKIIVYFFIQIIINLGMCYYLMIFCSVYHNTQGSITINYFTGVAESLAISLGLALITSLMRFISVKYKWRNIYYTSKFFFENF